MSAEKKFFGKIQKQASELNCWKFTEKIKKSFLGFFF